MSTSSKLLDAISVIADSKISKLNFDITITAEVVSLVDIDTGEYKVIYEGNAFSAFANDVSTVYEPGDFVYVKIPEGNYSNVKIIESKLSFSSQSNSTEIQDNYSQIGPTWDFMYGYDSSQKNGIIAGVQSNQPGYYAQIFESGDSSVPDSLFQNYTKEYDSIKFTASFLTQLVGNHSRGNYGIIVTFKTRDYTTDGQETIGKVSYRLDTTSFVGSPYGYTSYSPQSVILKTQKNFLLGLDSIILFQENLEIDKSVNYSGEVIYENTTKNNIFVKDISLSFIEPLADNNTSYAISILSPKGNSLINSASEIEFVGQLKYAGKDILSESSCDCYWFKENLEITKNHSNYSELGGIRWEKIEGDFNTLSIKYADVQYSQRYKLVIVYNNKVILSKQIEAYRYNNGYNFSLKQNTNGATITLSIVESGSSQQYLGNWYQQLPDGTYELIKQNANSIEINSLLIYANIDFYCEVIKDNAIFTNLYLTVLSSSVADDLEVSYNGIDLYSYDANGDVDIQDSEKERTLAVSLAWKEGVASAYKLEWYAADGIQLTSNPQTVSDSMLQNVWVDSDCVIHYTIRQKYYLDYNNNYFTLKVITVDGNEYSFIKEILFLKDGDQGTNGTTYVSAIRPADINTGLKLSGINGLIYNNGWSSPLYLRAFVYKDGEFINSDNGYEITYSWFGQGLKTVPLPNAEYCQIIGEGALDTKGQYLVKAEIKIKDKINSISTTIYYNYPVVIGVNEVNFDLIDINIPNYIKYSSSGERPSYYNEPIDFKYNGQDKSSQVSSLNNNLISVVAYESYYKIKPVSKFLYENGIAALKCLVNSNSYIIYPIMMYLDTYGNEAINGWDGTSIETENGSILAPQIGAGEKDADNKFTGVVMGKDTQQKKIGLYGYQEGVSTFGLLEDGTAYFGSVAGGGQIKIYGQDSIIEGGGGGNEEHGFSIILTNKTQEGDTKAINISNSNFYVQYDGFMHAENVDITGDIKANYLEAKKGGKIGDFDISETGLSGGTITCNSLTARSTGYIGDFVISNSGLSGGSITCKYLNAKIAGSIGNFDFDQNGLSGGSITCNYLEANKLTIKDLGYIGLVTGADDSGTTYNIGIESDSEDSSIILSSKRNIGLRTVGSGQSSIFIEGDICNQNSSTLNINSDVIYITTDKNDQHGIYARFA